MTITIYNDWLETPEGYNSPISTAGFRSIYRQVLSICPNKLIMNNKRFRNLLHSTKDGNYLVRLTDKDYINEFIGKKTDCIEFVKDCLSDLGIVKEKRGRTRFKRDN